MNGIKHIERVETEDGHILIQQDTDNRTYLTVAGYDTSGKAKIAFVTMSPKEREALKRALGEGFLETGK